MGLTLTIVRHGNTFAPGEPPRRIGAHTDLPLVPSGREQARALGIHFRSQGVCFRQVLTSPLLRTRETAALILAENASTPAIETRAWLAEIDHGPDENQAESAVLSRIGANALDDWDRHALPPVGWTVNAADRLEGWRDIFRQRNGDGDILLVTSNGAARFALLANDRLHAQTAMLASLKLRTGSFGRIIVEPDGPRLDGWDIRP